MNTKQLLIASLLSLTAFGAYADAGVTRAEVKQELKNEFEVRQYLAQHREVAAKAGCDLNAASHESDAALACNNLVQKMVATKSGEAKVAGQKAGNKVH